MALNFLCKQTKVKLSPTKIRESRNRNYSVSIILQNTSAVLFTTSVH